MQCLIGLKLINENIPIKHQKKCFKRLENRFCFLGLCRFDMAVQKKATLPGDCEQVHFLFKWRPIWQSGSYLLTEEYFIGTK